MEELCNLFNSFDSDVIAVVNLINLEQGWTYADEERTPCVSLGFPQYDNEFSDSWLICKGDFQTQNMFDYLNDDNYSISVDQSEFKSVSPPMDWNDYIVDSEKAFGITIKNHQDYVEWLYIVPIREDWEEMYKQQKDDDDDE